MEFQIFFNLNVYSDLRKKLDFLIFFCKFPSENVWHNNPTKMNKNLENLTSSVCWLIQVFQSHVFISPHFLTSLWDEILVNCKFLHESLRTWNYFPNDENDRII